MIADGQLPIKCAEPNLSMRKNMKYNRCITIPLGYVRPNTEQQEENRMVEMNGQNLVLRKLLIEVYSCPRLDIKVQGVQLIECSKIIFTLIICYIEHELEFLGYLERVNNRSCHIPTIHKG